MDSRNYYTGGFLLVEQRFENFLKEGTKAGLLLEKLSHDTIRHLFSPALERFNFNCFFPLPYAI